MDDKMKILEIASKCLDPDQGSLEVMQRQMLSFTNGKYNNMSTTPTFFPREKFKDNLLTIGASHQFTQLIEHMDKNIFKSGINPTQGEMSYIPLGGLPTSALAEYISSVHNKVLSHYFEAPGALDVERQLIKWTADLFGFPSETLGNITSCGSVANLMAIITARDDFEIEPEDVRKSVVYITNHTHCSIVKGLKMAGLGKCIVHLVDVDSNYSMNPIALQEMVNLDLMNDLKPFLVVATCGTTDTGSIDPMSDIADVCQEHNIWLHVDGAYGGYFALVEELRLKMKGIERADSIAVDPHKTLFVPYACSILIVRDGRKLYETFHVKSNYFIHDASETWDASDARNPSDLSLEMSRPFRGFKMWLPLLLHGVESFAACLKEKHLLARYFHVEVQKLGFAVGPIPDLSICIHRYIPKNGANPDAYNQRLMEAVRRDRRIYVSSTMIDGVFWIRLAVLQFRTHLDTIRMYLKMLRKEVEIPQRG